MSRWLNIFNTPKYVNRCCIHPALLMKELSTCDEHFLGSSSPPLHLFCSGTFLYSTLKISRRPKKKPTSVVAVFRSCRSIFKPRHHVTFSIEYAFCIVHEFFLHPGGGRNCIIFGKLTVQRAVGVDLCDWLLRPSDFYLMTLAKAPA